MQDGTVVINHENDEQLIISVILADGRDIVIDMPKHKSDENQTVQAFASFHKGNTNA